MKETLAEHFQRTKNETQRSLRKLGHSNVSKPRYDRERLRALIKERYERIGW